MYLICPFDIKALKLIYSAWGFADMSHLVAIKDVGQLVRSQFCVRADAGTCPAHPHLACRHCLKLKVPLSLGDSVRLFCPEDAHLVPAGVLQAMASCSEKVGKKIRDRSKKNIDVCCYVVEDLLLS